MEKNKLNRLLALLFVVIGVFFISEVSIAASPPQLIEYGDFIYGLPTQASDESFRKSKGNPLLFYKRIDKNGRKEIIKHQHTIDNGDFPPISGAPQSPFYINSDYNGRKPTPDFDMRDPKNKPFQVDLRVKSVDDATKTMYLESERYELNGNYTYAKDWGMAPVKFKMFPAPNGEGIVHEFTITNNTTETVNYYPMKVVDTLVANAYSASPGGDDVPVYSRGKRQGMYMESTGLGVRLDYYTNFPNGPVMYEASNRGEWMKAYGPDINNPVSPKADAPKGTALTDPRYDDSCLSMTWGKVTLAPNESFTGKYIVGMGDIANYKINQQVENLSTHDGKYYESDRVKYTIDLINESPGLKKVKFTDTLPSNLTDFGNLKLQIGTKNYDLDFSKYYDKTTNTLTVSTIDGKEIEMPQGVDGKLIFEGTVTEEAKGNPVTNKVIVSDEFSKLSSTVMFQVEAITLDRIVKVYTQLPDGTRNEVETIKQKPGTALSIAIPNVPDYQYLKHEPTDILTLNQDKTKLEGKMPSQNTDVTIFYRGILQLLNVPQLGFGSHSLTPLAQQLPALKGAEKPITIKDTRGIGSNWSLRAKGSSTDTFWKDSHVKHRLNGMDPTTITENDSVVSLGQTPSVADQTIDAFDAQKGFYLDIPVGGAKMGNHHMEITWTLSEVPDNPGESGGK